jgi:predicted DNA-binding protein with PD1-like motif
LLHLTILTAGKTLISSQINFLDRRTISLGLISHSPMQGRISPGTLHLLLLARYAAAEGFEAIDLTPGGEYKDRFASFTDPTRVVSIQFSATQAVRAQVRRFASEQAKTRIREMGLEPVAVKKQFDERVEHVRRAIAVARGGVNGGHARGTAAEICIFRIPTVVQSSERKDDPAPSMAALRIDEVADLLLPRSSAVPLHGRRADLRAALARFERGAQLITRTDGARVTNQAWMIKGPGKAHFSSAFADYEVPDKFVLVHDVIGDGNSVADQRFLDDALTLARARNPKLELLVAANADDPTSRRLADMGGELTMRISSQSAMASGPEATVAADAATEQPTS